MSTENDVESSSVGCAKSMRRFHSLPALATVEHLSTNPVMRATESEASGLPRLARHRVGGPAAAGLSLGFCLVWLARKCEAAARAPIPWLSAARRALHRPFVVVHLFVAPTLRLPQFNAEGAMASAVHGGGLMLLSIMAAMGMVFFGMRGTVSRRGWTGANRRRSASRLPIRSGPISSAMPGLRGSIALRDMRPRKRSLLR